MSQFTYDDLFRRIRQLTDRIQKLEDRVQTLESEAAESYRSEFISSREIRRLQSQVNDLERETYRISG